MTIDKKKMIKISISVDGEMVGGMIATNANYNLYANLIDAISNNESISVIKIDRGQPIYKNGTKFNKNTNTFVAIEEGDVKINESFFEVFSLVGDTAILHTELLHPISMAALVAAYQSNPTFAIQEVDYE
jgi:hypothetical protein